jgi:transposase
MSRFVTVNRDTAYLLPPSVDEWLPQEHLARYVVEVVEALDLSAMTRSYAGRGSDAHHPAVLVALLIYGYATGTYSSRKIEAATYDSLAFRYIAGNTHPDHDTLATFRKRFIGELKQLFVQVLLIARENRLLKLGHIALDGTKVKANASRHSALSYGHIRELESQLQGEVAALLAKAEAADTQSAAQGLDIPAELARREERLARIAQAKAQIEARAAEQHAAEQAEYEAKRAAHEARRRRNAGKRGGGGRPPSPPSSSIEDKAQVNLTDEDSRIMPVAGAGFEQCYNAQLGVDTESRLIVITGVTRSSVDKQQVVPALMQLAPVAEALDQAPQLLIADNGFMSAANVTACVQHAIEPLFAMGRDKHHLGLEQRFAPEPSTPAPNEALAAMAHRLKTRAGKALYALRKSTVEPVIGIIKSVMGFDHFLLRGLANVTGEWNLACLAYNVKRMHRLQRT